MRGLLVFYGVLYLLLEGFEYVICTRPLKTSPNGSDNSQHSWHSEPWECSAAASICALCMHKQPQTSQAC